LAITDLIQLARPQHWIKNVVVLFPVVFASKMADPVAWMEAILAAAGFSLVASGAYVLNDIRDRHQDREHPSKRSRPVAAGTVSIAAALAEAGLLLAAGLALMACIGKGVLLLAAAYITLQTAYTLFLKQKMLIDVICVALGFVLRAVAGAVAIRVLVSPWLFICTFTLCLFMGFCKRANELATFGDVTQAYAHREVLIGYSKELLTHLITLSGAIAVVAFLLYATSHSPTRPAGADFLVYTLPLIIYAVFRFAMLSMRGAYSDPIHLIVHDRPFQLTCLLWVLAVVCILRWHGLLSSLQPDVLS